MQRRAVLMVEDEPLVAQVGIIILERGGYTVFHAATSADAINVWNDKKDSIDVILSDLSLPGLSGPQLVAQLHSERPQTPVVFMTGGSLDIAASLSHLADKRHFLEKPFTAEQLLSMMESACSAKCASAKN